MSSRSVVLVEDHQLVRAGLRMLIDDYAEYQVVGEAEDGEGAIELAGRLQPHLMILDLQMPRMDGVQALPQIKARCPHTRVLMVSFSDSGDDVMRCFVAGADGYLVKSCANFELQLALDALHDGHAFLSPKITRLVIERAKHAEDDAPALPERLLTPRQMEILRLVVAGKAAKEIAFELGLSVKTVEAHRAQLMERLGLRDLPSLVLYALRHGLIPAHPE